MELPLLVGGRSVRTGDWVTRENPVDPAETVGRAAAADAALVATAVEAAHAAAPGWSAFPVRERSAALDAAASSLEAVSEELAVLLARELGKVLRDARGEITLAVAALRFAADRAPALLEDRVLEDAEGRLVVARVPFGAVGAVTPWNAPVVLAAVKAASALVAGNTVVVKPSPVAPLAATWFLSTLAAALPAAVVSVVNGGAEAGRVVTAHPLIGKATFTGGSAVARTIMRAAAATTKPLVLELGGNDAAIFLDDADLSPQSLERAVFASFRTSGQVCMAAKRLYVHERRLAEFLEAYEDAARSLLVVGDPLAAGVTIGPLATAAQRDYCAGLVAEARTGGARVRTLGTVASDVDIDRGYFLRPALLHGVDEDAGIVREEQFGPAVPVLAFRDEDEAVARANGTGFGLGSSVWSADEERAFRLARRLEAGYTFVNSHNLPGLTLRAPFGGVKGSGFGREFGDEGILEYTQTHAINAPAPARGR